MFHQHTNMQRAKGSRIGNERTDQEGSAMDTFPKCPACGGSNLQAGKLSDFDRTKFTPNNRRSMWLCCRVPVVATSCLDCGAIVLSADPDKLRAAVGAQK